MKKNKWKALNAGVDRGNLNCYFKEVSRKKARKIIEKGEEEVFAIYYDGSASLLGENANLKSIEMFGVEREQCRNKVTNKRYSAYDADYIASTYEREPLKCPLCREEEMHLTEITNVTNAHLTYAWVCDSCPAVLFEYVVEQDTQALKSFLGRTV